MRFSIHPSLAQLFVWCTIACGWWHASSATFECTASESRRPAPAIASFADIAAKAGLTTPNVFGGIDTKKYIIETTGNGVAIFDYDNDGWPDILLVNGTRLEGFPAGQGSDEPSLPQQSRRHVHRCHRESWPDRDGLGARRLRRRLRQRWLGRSLRHLLRQEPPLPQRSWRFHAKSPKSPASRDRARPGARAAHLSTMTATGISILSWRTTSISIWRHAPAPGSGQHASGRAFR